MAIVPPYNEEFLLGLAAKLEKYGEFSCIKHWIETKENAEGNMINTFSNYLYMMVGLPRSGKTTKAMEFKLPIVNPDSIRLALHGKRFIPEAEPMVWTVAHLMVKSLFRAGHNAVVLDACNHTRKRRTEWKDKEWQRMYVPTSLGWFREERGENNSITKVPLYTLSDMGRICTERARALRDEEIIPIIEKMDREADPISIDETDGIDLMESHQMDRNIFGGCVFMR